MITLLLLLFSLFQDGPSPNGGGAIRIEGPSFAVAACTSNCVIQRNKLFKFVADHYDNRDTVGYRAYVNNGTGFVLRGSLPLSALQPPGVITFTFSSGLPNGLYQMKIAAYNNEGMEADSSPLSLRVSTNGK